MVEQKITIIVPGISGDSKVVDEENLHRVREEICGQTYKNIEVLWISGNENGTLAKEYNIALEQAKGEYVMFWNPNAKVTKDYVFEMYQMMKHKHCDLVCSSYGRGENPVHKEQKIYSWEEYLKNLIRHPHHDFYRVLWNKLYDMNRIRQNHLIFSEKVTGGYDFIFNMQYLNQKVRIGVLGNEFIHVFKEDVKENSGDVYKVLIDRLNDKNAMFAAYKFLFWRAKVDVQMEVLDEYMIKEAAVELAGVLFPFSYKQWSVIRKKCLQDNGITGKKVVFRVIKKALRLRVR